MLARTLLWSWAIVLTAGVACVAVDGVVRAQTISILADSASNPPREAVRAAEWNLVYLLGLVVGVTTGVGAAIGWHLWRRLTAHASGPLEESRAPR